MRQIVAASLASILTLMLVAGPAGAQDAGPDPVVVHDAGELPSHEAALSARADAFRGRLQEIGREMAAAARQAGPGGAAAAVDVVEMRHRPEIDGMKAAIRDFLAAHPDYEGRWSETTALALETAVTVLEMQAVLAAAGA